jgi:hypothetical protein
VPSGKFKAAGVLRVTPDTPTLFVNASVIPMLKIGCGCDVAAAARRSAAERTPASADAEGSTTSDPLAIANVTSQDVPALANAATEIVPVTPPVFGMETLWVAVLGVKHAVLVAAGRAVSTIGSVGRRVDDPFEHAAAPKRHERATASGRGWMRKKMSPPEDLLRQIYRRALARRMGELPTLRAR